MTDAIFSAAFAIAASSSAAGSNSLEQQPTVLTEMHAACGTRLWPSIDAVRGHFSKCRSLELPEKKEEQSKECRLKMSYPTRQLIY